MGSKVNVNFAVSGTGAFMVRQARRVITCDKIKITRRSGRLLPFALALPP